MGSDFIKVVTREDREIYLNLDEIASIERVNGYSPVLYCNIKICFPDRFRELIKEMYVKNIEYIPNEEFKKIVISRLNKEGNE